MVKRTKKQTTSEIYNAVYDATRQIPKGKVANYGIIGYMATVNPRVVGYALHSNPSSEATPCHRVVFKDGGLTPGYVFGGEDAQRNILTKHSNNAAIRNRKLLYPFGICPLPYNLNLVDNTLCPSVDLRLNG